MLCDVLRRHDQRFPTSQRALRKGKVYLTRLNTENIGM
jgi:hypothetical protein